MKNKFILALFFIFCWTSLLAAPPLKTLDELTLTAIKTSQNLHIDGVLEEDAWKNAPMATNFITSEPVFGQSAQQKTQVWLLYDDKAIYVAAQMFEDKAHAIANEMSVRDQIVDANTDYFRVGIDTYNDNVNANVFTVSAANVQGDFKINGTDYDDAWDAVWQSRATMHPNGGWVIEIRIPYSALRFPNKPVQTWGINFFRFSERTQEFTTWAAINPAVDGIINQWGSWVNLQNIKPPLRLSFTPYLGLSYERYPTNNSDNLPVTGYEEGKNINGGMDVKWGINESFTLDATLIPDFGQVQSDDKVLELGPFERRYNERRPFFTEGTELFSKGDIFYSRRIGGLPLHFFDAYLQTDTLEYVAENPTMSQLYNATKFSGRTAKNLGIGVLNVIQAPTHAAIINTQTNKTRRFETAPLTNYNVFVLDKVLKNNSSISLINTNLLRNGTSPDANVTALETRLAGSKNKYAFNATLKASQIFTAEQTQRGYNYQVGYGKISGTWRWKVSHVGMDKNYDPNDMGLQYGNNNTKTSIEAGYFQYKPNKTFNSWSVNGNFNYQTHFTPFAHEKQIVNINFNGQFTNFWMLSAWVDGSPFDTHDYNEPRKEDTYFLRPGYFFTGFNLQTDTRKKVWFSFEGNIADSYNHKDYYYSGQLASNFRFSQRLTATYTIFADYDQSNYGWVNTINQQQCLAAGSCLMLQIPYR
ncbi:MAG: carbohydrate binding family 9 domain-containing protein [Sphingobacteriales bacterium]|nr:carbohydrate binding family 9 domain-containing protein [Sphingobacteriales bacterium]